MCRTDIYIYMQECCVYWPQNTEGTKALKARSTALIRARKK